MAENEPTRAGRIGTFIQTYHGFLSTFVIGAAGLIATSIWQYRQSVIAAGQAASQQKVAETQAANSWKIERAEILSKNLQTLAAQGPGSVEQRYGVLLSLTRGNIIDPELAVSYALELGKENPEYMRSVLANTAGKDYQRLAQAFVPTCMQRFGVARNVELCSGDKLEERSAALADLVADEMAQKDAPLALLKDEREVQERAQRLVLLFTPGLVGLYQHRLWSAIAHFERYSTGARLVSALALSAARTGEMVSAEEQNRLQQFHAERRHWLTQYLVGSTCEAECRGKLLDIMLTSYAESQGDYDAALRALLERPRSESSWALSTLHARLLRCQVADDDQAQLRDRVLVPATRELVDKPQPDVLAVDDLVGLLALVPEPTDPTLQASWRALMEKLKEKDGGRFARVLDERRASANRERLSPPPAIKKKVSLCASP